MPTRRDILRQCYQSALTPEIREAYCSKCGDGARKVYQAGLVFPSANASGLLGSLGPALVAQLLLGCQQAHAGQPQAFMVQSPFFHHQYDAEGMVNNVQGSAPPQQLGSIMSYDKDVLGIGLNKEPDPLTARGAQNTPVRLKQPTRHRNFMRNKTENTASKSPDQDSPQERRGYEKKGPAKNPWAICTSSVGRGDKSKYEDCIQAVKSKSKIKKD